MSQPMCACGHTRKSHVHGYCIGCTGPDCLSGYEAAVHRHFDEPFASDLIEKTRAILVAAHNQELDDLAEEHHHGIAAALRGREDDECTCSGKGIRAKLVTIGHPADHQPGCPDAP